MAALSLQRGEDPAHGFSFDNCLRNEMLAMKGIAPPKAKKTGTTIVGCIFKDGVVLGADTRATEGPIVCDKNCEKIHYIAPNIYCCGAGTSADTENSTNLISAQVKLLRLNSGRDTRVVTALTQLKRRLFRYQGHISAALVLGGVDVTGPSLYTVYPHGSTDRLPYVTMGSGSLAAMSIFEAGWQPNLSKEHAINLVHHAIKAGIFNDLGSGSNVDVCVITKDGKEMLRNMDKANPRKFRNPKSYDFPKGTTEIISEEVILDEDDEQEDNDFFSQFEKMEI
uniref:proteasome endopeptidase complex n=1 Tax=Paramoeba aestuarina TaxID=180227 RepID=A0A7S4KXE1_9EUKA|eukprot:CAMPEP_0201516812 /NCGR_PEP_ID=MMETSP0161_2-20130828/8064_1 /ASSEMBLY_ACC=CAM_ASM_000251 /TAXON_ID=180227 /ORGANISM="Neoparamoeba aestuarina, Strain SoJaBio B1-5/56/2" /LENGTH=280 /DNA_ID=CAMNT_0047914095 /DNA_START=194 /DNA_END=1036 /DNA_ORIENTATION=+